MGCFEKSGRDSLSDSVFVNPGLGKGMLSIHLFDEDDGGKSWISIGDGQFAHKQLNTRRRPTPKCMLDKHEFEGMRDDFKDKNGSWDDKDMRSTWDDKDKMDRMGGDDYDRSMMGGDDRSMRGGDDRSMRGGDDRSTMGGDDRSTMGGDDRSMREGGDDRSMREG